MFTKLLSSFSEMADSKKWVAIIIGILAVIAADQTWISAGAEEKILYLVGGGVGVQGVIDIVEKFKAPKAHK